MFSTNLTPELSALLWSVLLLLTTIMTQQIWTDIAQGPKFALSDRLGGLDNDVSRRFERTVRNTVENLALFTPVILILSLSEISTTGTVRGAWLFLIARIVYAVAYPVNIPVVRSLAWLGGLIGVVMCAWPLLF